MGRVMSEGNGKPLNIRVEGAVLDGFEALSGQTGLTVSALVRLAMRTFLQEVRQTGALPLQPLQLPEGEEEAA